MEVERKFGHCIINWKIENYCLASCKKDWMIESPEFQVRGFQLTKWKMTLRAEVDESSRVTLCLERVDTGPDVVWANWEMSLLDRKEKSFCAVRHECFFSPKSSYSLDLESSACILSKILPFDTDALRVRCQLIVYKESLNKKFEKPHDAGLKSLSQDLKALYKRGKLYDIVLRIEGQDIRAHKAILNARNRNFSEINRKSAGKVMELSLVEFPAMENIVLYFYTGNLEVVLAKPSIALYECVTILDINELKSYYVPDELTLHSTVDSKEFVYLWLIKDFSFINEDCIVIPVFNKDIFDTACNLRLYPKGLENDVRHIAIFAEMLDSTKPFDLCMEFAIMDTNREFYWPRTVQRHTEGNEVLGMNDFVKRDSLENSSLLADDTLRIAFKFRASSGIRTATIGTRMMSSITSNTKGNSCDSLSIDIAGMYETGKYSDLVLTAGIRSFKVHKCIMVARSRVLANMIGKLKENETELALFNINPKILEILLSYLYSGVLKDLETSVTCRVYEAAETYAVSSLKDLCVNLLYDDIEVTNVCDILVFSESTQEMDLKLSALVFICCNAEAVYEQHNWHNLAAKIPSLSTEVIEYVNSNRDKFNSNAI